MIIILISKKNNKFKHNSLKTQCSITAMHISSYPFIQLINRLAIVLCFLESGSNLFIINKLIRMKLFQRKRRYSKISYNKRLQLIELVQQQTITISRAAKRLHIKLPTAKVILSNYRKNDKIFNKIIEERKPLEQEQSPKVEETQIKEEKKEKSDITMQPLYFCYYVLPNNSMFFY